MPLFRLGTPPVFPPPDRAEPDGLLAIGGDLSPTRLVAAYRAGIFPWYDQPGGPILWWSPEPRMVLFPAELRVTRRLERTIRQGRFHVAFDAAFEDIVAACAGVDRPDQDGTWITPEMREAYARLFRLGFATCCGAWRGDRLVGGIYGVRLGRAFFGESMFHVERDASKVAFVALVRRLAGLGFELVDCQVPSEHLESLGARPIARAEFLDRLAAALRDRPDAPAQEPPAPGEQPGDRRP